MSGERVNAKWSWVNIYCSGRSMDWNLDLGRFYCARHKMPFRAHSKVCTAEAKEQLRTEYISIYMSRWNLCAQFGDWKYSV